MSTFITLIRREFWEHRAFYVVPGIVAVILIAALVYALALGAEHTGLDRIVDKLATLPPERRNGVAGVLALGTAVPFNIALSLIVFFYLIDSLYAERKDRSILFWKSLPVSDTASVLSKFAIAVIVLPLLTLLVMTVTLAVNGMVLTASIWAGGGSAWELLWGPAPVFGTLAFLFYAFAVQSLWYTPIAGWLLLSSAWARSSPMLWAFAPPLALMLLEEMLFGTFHVAALLRDRLVGVFPLAFDERAHGAGHGLVMVDGDVTKLPEHVLSLVNPTGLLASPGLWGGLLAAALFVGGAIWLRRYRDES